ncbi:MAG TPA: gas vesicle protein [Chloroflexota bacterium]
MTLEPRRPYQGTNLVDILDRILDKGLVVAGDVRISLANVELLTIRIRLLVCSIDKAEQIGLNWWRYDRNLVSQDETETTIARLEQRIAELELQLAAARTIAAESPEGPSTL